MTTIDLLKELEWKTLYYAKVRSWLPLSSVPNMKQRLQGLSAVLGKSEKELFIYILNENINKTMQTATKSYHQFCLEIATYMYEKDVDFEIALKRTHALKAYQQLVYRKSAVKEIILSSIQEYGQTLEKYGEFISVYQGERVKQIEELQQAVQQVKEGSKEVVLSSELMITLLYKQMLGYKAEYDTLTNDDPMKQALNEIETFIMDREKNVWG